jgi:hypothetical protein
VIFLQSGDLGRVAQAVYRLLVPVLTQGSKSVLEQRFHDFSDLDSRFHRLINSAAPNRFIDDFYDIITLIFHYHYQWNKQDECKRNEVAIHEHLTYIEALLSRNISMVDLACRAHLASAKETLIRSTSVLTSEWLYATEAEPAITVDITLAFPVELAEPSQLSIGDERKCVEKK